MTFLLNIQHNLEIYFILTHHIKDMGWTVDFNAHLGSAHWQMFPNKLADVFQIDIERKLFTWFGNSGKPLADVIETPDQAHEFVKFLRANHVVLADVPEKPEPVYDPYAPYYDYMSHVVSINKYGWGYNSYKTKY